MSGFVVPEEMIEAGAKGLAPGEWGWTSEDGSCGVTREEIARAVLEAATPLIEQQVMETARAEFYHQALEEIHKRVAVPSMPPVSELETAEHRLYRGVLAGLAALLPKGRKADVYPRNKALPVALARVSRGRDGEWVRHGSLKDAKGSVELMQNDVRPTPESEGR